MPIRRQNCSADFILTERFYQNGTLISVPSRLELRYYTEERPDAVFLADRNGNTCNRCKVSNDGKSLSVYLSLSRNPIGRGRLLRSATVITSNADFPDGIKKVTSPAPVDVILWEGASDDSMEVVGTVETA